MAISECEVKTMKLAIAIAILRSKPKEHATSQYIQTLSTSWNNRNTRDERYIRWLELERLQLLQKTALLTAEKSGQHIATPEIQLKTDPISVDQSLGCFLQSTMKFLQVLPSTVDNFEEVLDASTEDLVRNVREMVKEPELFTGTFAPILEQCCAGFLKISLCSKAQGNLVSLAEVLVNFVTMMETNRVYEEAVDDFMECVSESKSGNKKEALTQFTVEEKEEKKGRRKGVEEKKENKGLRKVVEEKEENPFAPKKEEHENDTITLVPSVRCEKQVIVSCIVSLSQHPTLTRPLQRLLVRKIHDICSSLTGLVAVQRPEVVESLYYLVEGLYGTGEVREEETAELLRKCVEETVVRFPVVSRFLLVCGARKGSKIG